MKTVRNLLILGFCLPALAGPAAARERPATEAAAAEENLTAAETLNACTKLIPSEPLLLKGSLTVRKLRGIVLLDQPFKLLMDWGARTPTAEVLLLDPSGTSLVERAVLSRPEGRPAQIKVFDGPEQTPVESPSYAGRVRGTDMTWMDLTLDFLWWKDVRFDDTPRGESHNGRDCDILVAVPPWPIPGCSAVRIWVDRQLRCLMQVEQLDPQGTAVRKMWVQRVKKMDDRWMIRDMEIETLNSGHRTKLFVDDVSKP
ncbi:MAG: outer membrane lipoprotein-sorting protein [Verrucomicrobiota bacterium]|nr:outer membrane lipoprotein-sorting protein [Verrucomicrobiota bacterium]